MGGLSAIQLMFSLVQQIYLPQLRWLNAAEPFQQQIKKASEDQIHRLTM